MRLATIGVRNVLRNRFRTSLTILGVAVAIIAFVMLQTIISSWTAGAEFAAKDRVVTRHKVSLIMSLPGKYVSEIEQLSGVVVVSAAHWFGGKDPKHEDEFFASMAVQPDSFLRVYDEVSITATERDAWKADRTGAIVGDAIANKLGWKVGDRVVLQGTIYPGDWSFTIRGIYEATRQSMDRTSFFFHFDYLNEWIAKNYPRGANEVGWVVSRLDSNTNAVEMAQRIDAHFDERDVQTLSQDERAFATSFLGMLDAVLRAVDVVSIVILVIMMLILGNTIAMGVRERTSEYGVLRAIGFLPKHLVVFVLGEAATVGILGGGLGLLVAYPLVEKGMGRFLEENMGSFFPFFRIAPATALLALGLAVLLGLCAAVIPAYQASKLEVISSIRKVG